MTLNAYLIDAECISISVRAFVLVAFREAPELAELDLVFPAAALRVGGFLAEADVGLCDVVHVEVVDCGCGYVFVEGAFEVPVAAGVGGLGRAEFYAC